MRKAGPFAAFAAPLAMAMLLSGCSFGLMKPPNELLTLTPNPMPPVGTTVSGNAADAILVLEPEAGRTLGVPRIPVQIDPARLAYLKDAVWVDHPARLMQRLIADTVRVRTGRLVSDDIAVRAGTILSGRLVTMGYDVPSQSVVVRFDAELRTRGGPTTARRFEATVPNVEAKANPVGLAMNQAANDVAGQIAAWVAGS